MKFGKKYFFLYCRIQVLPDNFSIVDLLADGSNNAFITDSEHLSYIEKSLNGTKKFTKLKEVVLYDYLGFAFKNNDYLFQSINHIITQIYEAGIAELIVKNEAAIKYDEPDKKPVVLTWHHLGIWFYLVVFLLTSSIILFILELLVHKSRFYSVTQVLKVSFLTANTNFNLSA